MSDAGESGAPQGASILRRARAGVRAVRRRIAPRRGPVVISFPKSGRTQLRVMLDALGLAPAFSHAGSSDERGRTIGKLIDGPDYWKRCRVLFMMRDPRDTATSAYFHARFRSGVFDGPFSDFLRDPRFGLEKILLFHLLWLERRPPSENFQVLRYEALQRDPAQQLRAAVAFLFSRDLTEAEVQRALDAGRFDAMRTMETTGEGAQRFGWLLTPGDPARPESFKTRRGVIGDWKNHFSEEDAAYAESLIASHRYRERLAALGVSGSL